MRMNSPPITPSLALLVWIKVPITKPRKSNFSKGNEKKKSKRYWGVVTCHQTYTSSIMPAKVGFAVNASSGRVRGSVTLFFLPICTDFISGI